MRLTPFDSAVAGKSVLITETRMEPVELLGRVGSTSFVIAGSRRPFCPESLNPYELMGAALGSCTVMILRLHADRMGLDLSRIQVSVSHHSGHPETVALFERTIFVEGSISAEDRVRCTVLFLGTENYLAGAPASSDYKSDIGQTVGAGNETSSHMD